VARHPDPPPPHPPGLRSVGGPKLRKWGLSGRGSNLLTKVRPTPYVYYPRAGGRYTTRDATQFRDILSYLSLSYLILSIYLTLTHQSSSSSIYLILSYLYLISLISLTLR
jgi:hypothetical protein